MANIVNDVSTAMVGVQMKRDMDERQRRRQRPQDSKRMVLFKAAQRQKRRGGGYGQIRR